MSPVKKGFNIVGYVMPFVMLLGAGVVVGALIRRWGARAALQPKLAPSAPVDATKEELDALQAAIRDDS
mgnify:CR=1 FL=1